ncbi:MAG: putative manganese-dependent inorganic diphosphatase [Coriobacteriia bacterium]|nr:putative manganese-dependent inorganic diphosphatase [Coriobacteriia bacterium]MBN2839685.1 putative manganese-dependent inorganic diphosphatase [Coriobacteriia bacterium]
MGPVFVFGHRNPDNDSVCSAVAYAHLKNVTDPEGVYVPARLGPMPPETSWTFARFGVDEPVELSHVRARVRDAMSPDVITIGVDDNLRAAGALMREHGVRALPVVDEAGAVQGLLHQGILAELYINETELLGFERLPMTVAEIAEVVEGRILCGHGATVLSGHVVIGAMEPGTMVSYIHPGDTLIVGDRVRTQPLALEAGAACLIVTGGSEPGEVVLERARELGAAIVSSPHDTYATARLVNLGHSVGGVMDPSPLLVDPDALMAEVAEDLIDSPHREAIVVDHDSRLLGILTRSNLARGVRRRVILLDHNEASQSAPGIEEAAVIEIVDHHRVGDIQTASPILFLNLPVGSTATIVAERYRELGVTPPDSMAGVLLSAVLSDTVLLKSPTTTDLDRVTAQHLAAQLDLDPIEFGLEMFRARAAQAGFSAEDAVSRDLKEYRAGDVTIGVAQVETVDADEYRERAVELAAALEAFRVRRGLDLAMLLVTDVVREGSEVYAAGKTRVAERALGIDLGTGSAWMAGVLSRKKQIASHLLESIGG